MTTTSVRSTVHSPARRPQRPTRPSAAAAVRTPRAASPVAHQVDHPVGSPVRLTRRGRVVLLVLLVAGVLALISFGRPGAHAATTPDRVTTATVQAGDSLWSVARRELPRADTRQAVAQIELLNHLDSSTLQAGQQLLLPAG